MSLDIKYNYPHTFFLSVGIITFIFGVYPFYINNFYFSMIHWTKIVIHLTLLVLSVTCLLKGFSLWDRKESERKDFENIRKKRMEQEIDLNQQKMEEFKLTNEIKKLTSEKSSSTERKRMEKEIEELKIKIMEKEKELTKAKKEEISRFPGVALSGSVIFPTPVSNFPLASSGAIYSDQIAIGNTSLKKCPTCGNLISSNTTFCYFCQNRI
jgi:hypothetical protein